MLTIRSIALGLIPLCLIVTSAPVWAKDQLEAKSIKKSVTKDDQTLTGKERDLSARPDTGTGTGSSGTGSGGSNTGSGGGKDGKEESGRE